MVNVTLTAKTSKANKLTHTLPTTEKATVLTTINVYDEIILGGTFSPVVILDNWAYMILEAKATSAHNIQYEIRKTDGTTVLVTGTAITHATSYGNLIVAGIFQIDNLSDWVDVRLFARNINGSGETLTIQQDTIAIIQAPRRNLTDVLGVLMKVSELKFYSGGVSEGFNGLISDSDDFDFTTMDETQLLSKIVWSANSGNTIWDWAGQEIGIE
jgi:hypothetical protein